MENLFFLGGKGSDDYEEVKIEEIRDDFDKPNEEYGYETLMTKYSIARKEKSVKLEDFHYVKVFIYFYSNTIYDDMMKFLFLMILLFMIIPHLNYWF